MARPEFRKKASPVPRLPFESQRLSVREFKARETGHGVLGWVRFMAGTAQVGVAGKIGHAEISGALIAELWPVNLA